MGITWLLVFLSVVALSSAFMLDNLRFPIWASWLYAWIPGLLALVWARTKKIKIPLFPQKKQFLLWALIGGFFLGGTSFFISEYFFGTPLGESASVKNAALYFFSYYTAITFSFFFLFIGGEFCWRGYLWEQWEKHSLKGGIGIWVLWSMWLAPTTIIFSKNLFAMLFLNFSLMPFLHYFRAKSKSIIPGTVFYSSIYGSSIYFQVLFSSVQEHPQLSVIQGAVLIATAIGYILINKKKK